MGTLEGYFIMVLIVFLAKFHVYGEHSIVSTVCDVYGTDKSILLTTELIVYGEERIIHTVLCYQVQ